MSVLAAFSRVVTDATLQLGEAQFAETLSNGTRELVAADDVSLIRYHESGAPTIEYTLPPKRRGSTTLDRYVKGPFLLDPFYLCLHTQHHHDNPVLHHQILVVLTYHHFVTSVLLVVL